jgi:uncharacterized protein YqeY
LTDDLRAARLPTSFMTLQERIESAMRDAMRARDQRRTLTLRMAMAAIQNRRIELRRELDDAEVAELLGKQAKQRRESLEIFRDAGRESMAANEEAELAIITEFLPQQLSSDELEQLVREAIAATGASGPKDMGKVMGRIAGATKGRADGRALSELVRRMLTAG